MTDFDNGQVTEALKSALIITQQTEILNEILPDVASDFGLTKSMAKKIVMAYAKDNLSKTQEKMEDERSALANAEVMIEAIEGVSVSTDVDDLPES